MILYKGSTELSHSFAINKAMTKAEFNSLLASETSTLAQRRDGLKFVVYDLSADVSVDNPKAKSVTLSSFDDGVNLFTAAPSKITETEATKLLLTLLELAKLIL